MHAQYFALLNLSLKLQFYGEASLEIPFNFPVVSSVLVHWCSILLVLHYIAVNFCCIAFVCSVVAGVVMFSSCFCIIKVPTHKTTSR